MAVIEVDRPDKLAEPAQDSNLSLEPARVDVLPVTGDMPAAGQHQPRAGCREVEHRLSGPCRVAVDTRGTSTARTPSHPATACLMTSRSSVAPGTTVMRPVSASSLAMLCSRHTPATS